jgi:hypothetical protein
LNSVVEAERQLGLKTNTIHGWKNKLKYKMQKNDKNPVSLTPEIILMYFLKFIFISPPAAGSTT